MHFTVYKYKTLGIFWVEGWIGLTFLNNNFLHKFFVFKRKYKKLNRVLLLVEAILTIDTNNFNLLLGDRPRTLVYHLHTYTY